MKTQLIKICEIQWKLVRVIFISLNAYVTNKDIN